MIVREILDDLCCIIQALCKSFPLEFTSYFHYCRSLRFEDKPNYSYLRGMFHDLFIREGQQKHNWRLVFSSSIFVEYAWIWLSICVVTGYQFDYVFDWTILKYPQISANPRLPVCFSRLSCYLSIFTFFDVFDYDYEYYFSFSKWVIGMELRSRSLKGLKELQVLFLFWSFIIIIDKVFLLNYFCLLSGPMIRDRFSAAVETLAWMNASGSGHHGDNSKRKSPNHVLLSSKQAVSSICFWPRWIICVDDIILLLLSGWFWENPPIISQWKYFKEGYCL